MYDFFGLDDWTGDFHIVDTTVLCVILRHCVSSFNFHVSYYFSNFPKKQKKKRQFF